MQLPRRRVTEIAVIGLLAAGLVLIGRANLQSTRRDSAALTCRSNMRAILHEAGLYAADMQIAEASAPEREKAAVWKRTLSRSTVRPETCP